MTSSIIWVLYLADVLAGVHGLLIFIACAFCLFGASACVALTVEKWWSPEWKVRIKWVAGIGLAAAFTAALLPSRQTLYASAAVYAGGQLADTEEFRLVRQIVTQELRKMVEPKK